MGQTAGTEAAAPPPPPAQEEADVSTPDGTVHVRLPAGTKSVMKQSGGSASSAVGTADGVSASRSGYDAPLVPVQAAQSRMVDPNVRQTQGVVPLDDKDPASEAAAANASAQAATDLMTQALTGPKDGALAGHPVTLYEVLSHASQDRNRMLSATRAYWKLSTAQADFNWAADELGRLNQIRSEKGLERAMLTTAQAAGQARVYEAKVGALQAQQELADLIGVPASSPPPLTSDLPLVGPYRTFFDSLFAGRAAPPRTKVIDRGLSSRRDAIDARVAAVYSASTAAHLAEDSRAREQGQTDLQTVLNCQTELARQRRAMLTAVRDYNLDIGEYAIAVADPGMGLDRLVAMMIVVKPPAAVTATTGAPNRPADASSPLGHTQLDDLLLQPAVPSTGAAQP